MNNRHQPSGVVAHQWMSEHKISQARSLRQQMTPAEACLWRVLRAHRFRGLKFRRQQPIDGFIVDFYCEALLLVVEIDGPVHLLPEQKTTDALRERIFKRRGIRTVRLNNENVLRDPLAAAESAVLRANS